MKFAGLLIAAGVLAAQQPAFEVATIKPADPETKGRFIRMQSAHQFLARNHVVKTLIAAAYDLNPHAISGGPAWAESDRYEILAKTPGERRPDLNQQMAMLRTLLADRFKLAFHREEKEMSHYVLTVAKGGPKLPASTFSPDDAPEGAPALIFVLSPEGVRLPARYATMGEFASVLQRASLDRPVIDRTGLAGRYDFTLEFAADESQFGGAAPHAPDPSRPDLFTALQQQLGLKLEAVKGPVPVLIIDHVERPSEN